MTTIWVVVAESSRARILQSDKPSAALRELEDLTHPESRLHEQELTSDLPGRAFDSKGEGRHAMGQVVSPKEQASIDFAKALSERLEAGRIEGAYQKLVVVAAPEFLGLLRKSLSDETKKQIIQQVNKNLVQHDLSAIRAQLTKLLPGSFK